MKITDVENMSADELKAKRAEIEKAVADSPELAARYVKARLDATTRDVKLAEQGKTIVVLQDALEAAKATAADLEATHATVMAEAEAKWNRGCELLGNATDRVDALAAQAKSLSEELGAMTKERDAVQSLAKQRRTVLAELQMTIAPLLASE